MKETTAIFLILIVNVLVLLYGASTLSISYHEAKIFFNGSNVIHYLVRGSCALFGQNDFALRLPFIFLHVGSVILLFKISKPILKRKIDRVASVLIYVLLPGTISAALLINGAGIIIFVTLLFVYLHQENRAILSLIVLSLSLFLDSGFIILYFILFFYAVSKRDTKLLVVSLALFTVAAYFYNFEISGKPKGYFLDTFGVYAAIFSPFLFLFFIYTQYRILIKEEKSTLWWISFCAFVFSLLLSFRQRIPFEDFAPYAVIATPLLVRSFLNSYRVRLPQFRKTHKIFLTFVLLSLFINSTLAIFNHSLYSFFDDKNDHFAYRYHVAKELADILHEKNVNSLHVKDKKLAIRLKFYGIEDGIENELISKKNGVIKIIYSGILIESYKISKM